MSPVQPTDPGLPLLLIGLFALAATVSKLYLDRRARATVPVRIK